MTKYSILLVDDNLEYQISVHHHFLAQEHISKVDIASDGLQALEKLRHNRYDMILMELILPNLDGITLLEHLNQVGGEQPAIIIVSALRNESIIQYVFTLGVRCFFVKPIDQEALYQRVLNTFQPEITLPSSSNLSIQTLYEEITFILLTAGIPAHVKGYHYLREGISMVFYKPKLVNRVTKYLYPGIAKKFATSPSKVERDIRHAVEVAWTREKIVNINKIFGCEIYTKYEKPTNSELIGLIVERLIMKYCSDKGAFSPQFRRNTAATNSIARIK